jgi:hypothetical protein
LSPSFSVAVDWPLSKEPPTMPTCTDLPSFAIETSRKMFSVTGNVPFTATRSQTPLVAIRASVATAGGAVGADGVVAPGVVLDGLEGDGVGGVPTGTTGGGASVEVVVDVGGSSGGLDGVVEVVVVTCGTNGSLVLNRPKEMSWLASRWTTTRSLGSWPAGTAGVAAGAAAPDTVVTAWGTAVGPPLPPRSFGSWKPRTARRITEPTAMKIFCRRTRRSASDLTVALLGLMLRRPSRR